MKIPKNIEITSSTLLSKKEKKQAIKDLLSYNFIANENDELKLIKCKEKLQIITNNRTPVLFSIKSEYLPTINVLSNSIPELFIILDEGARKPLKGGADVMKKGILKFKNEIPKFKKSDFLVIFIYKEIFGLGKALCDYEDVTDDSLGVGVEVVHVQGDSLCNMIG